jgi:hypothetical protein
VLSYVGKVGFIPYQLNWPLEFFGIPSALTPVTRCAKHPKIFFTKRQLKKIRPVWKKKKK